MQGRVQRLREGEGEVTTPGENMVNEKNVDDKG